MFKRIQMFADGAPTTEMIKGRENVILKIISSEENGKTFGIEDCRLSYQAGYDEAITRYTEKIHDAIQVLLSDKQ